MATTTELNITGVGVAPVRIPEVDALATIYVELRDKRMSVMLKEVAAKQELVEMLHAHADEITMPDGTLRYHFDDNVITLAPGKEKLKVESRDFDAVED